MVEAQGLDPREWAEVTRERAEWDIGPSCRHGAISKLISCSIISMSVAFQF